MRKEAGGGGEEQEGHATGQGRTEGRDAVPTITASLPSTTLGTQLTQPYGAHTPMAHCWDSGCACYAPTALFPPPPPPAPDTHTHTLIPHLAVFQLQCDVHRRARTLAALPRPRLTIICIWCCCCCRRTRSGLLHSSSRGSNDGSTAASTAGTAAAAACVVLLLLVVSLCCLPVAAGLDVPSGGNRGQVDGLRGKRGKRQEAVSGAYVCGERGRGGEERVTNN